MLKVFIDNLALSLCCACLLLVAACSAATSFDASSEASIKQSVTKMAGELNTDQQKQQFLTDLLIISLSLQQAKQHLAAKQVKRASNQLLHGKNTKQIRRLAAKLDVMSSNERHEWLVEYIKREQIDDEKPAR